MASASPFSRVEIGVAELDSLNGLGAKSECDGVMAWVLL